ncbi:hypothetical protein D3C84_734670 [compost metagenome]
MTADLSVVVSAATVIVAGVAAPPPDGTGETPVNLSVIPLTASVMVLLLDSISTTPSILYFAFCGVVRTEVPVSSPELPDKLRSEPTPVLLEVSTMREPLASVRMLALKPWFAY